jgi:hypothetical protein
VKAGAVPYWHCGGEVLTRCLDREGGLVARAVGADEAAALAAFYGGGPEGAALAAAMRKVDAWLRAATLLPG